MMKDYFEGWEEKADVQIPERKQKGFQDRMMKPQAYIRRISTGEEAAVDKDGFVIGKSVEADFVVKSNPTVSRKHVKINLRPDGCWLEDLGSSNHVFVDGRQITEPVRLADGMKFTLSLDEEFEFIVRMGKKDG